MARTIQDLQQMQALPLKIKISMTKQRIRDWVNYYGLDGVYVSFSGGKDSTVLLTVAREMYPSMKAVFVDTGLEYPEIREFVRSFDNVDWIKPKMNFREVIKKYGTPIISKEVAECVYGARKYLTAIEAQMNASNERTNERTNEPVRMHSSIVSCADAMSMLDPTGGGTTTSTEDSEDSASIRLVTALEKDYEKTIDNIRIQRLMGILSTKGMTKGEIPEKDRSAFACTRYQFFLDAPFEIGQQCCNVMKKQPGKKYTKETGRVPMTAMMASESRLRTQKWLKQGCNAFDAKKPMSNPMAFWTEQDVLLYIYRNHIPIASVYGDVVKENEVDGQLDFEDLGLFELERPCLKTTGASRTGCMFCLFGIHLERNPNRLELMKDTHLKLYDYMMRPESEGGLGYKEKLDWINEHGNMDIKY